MFSANISGVIKRVVFDNEEDGKDAMLKIVIEARKQFAKKDDMPNVYPLVTIWGHDAAYVRDFAGKGHWIEIINCDLDVYRGDDDEQDRISFKAGKINLLPKVMSEAVADTIDEDDDDEPKKKKKKKSSRDDDKKKGKSRSERRKKPRDDDDEDEDEDEKPRKKKAKGKASDGAKKKSSSKKSRRKDDEDEDFDEDYDDEDDDDDYFDDED